MKVIIPVAGLGTRMRPHTHTKPKPLLNVAGKPGVTYIMDELEKLDVSEVIFITGFLKEKFEDFIKKNYKFKARFIEQKVFDGTAGAALLAEKYINEPVLIIFVDTIFDLDLGIIKNLKKDESGIIWTKEVEDYQRYGVCLLNKHGYLTKIVEKPKEPISKLAAIGIAYIKDYKGLYKAIHYIFDHKITLKNEYFLTDAYEHMVKKGAKFLCPEAKGWYDFGKVETLLESNRLLLEKFGGQEFIGDAKNSMIIPPVSIAADAKISNSVIGPYATIESGCIINDCIVRDSLVCKNSKLTRLLIRDSMIGDSTELAGSFQKLNIGDNSAISPAPEATEKK